MENWKENKVWHRLKVLSLFDGMSCWMIALERAWIKVDTYYASEIDKYATQISEKNYPNIIRLWDVNNWRDWNLWEIDLIIWGSPCQWFSFAGKQLAFDDTRSKLFFTMVDIINYYKPKYFLLENVRMKKEYQDIITEYMWVNPININSKLVSAQLRNRFYWTNIHWVEQPKDKWIIIQDILEENVEDKYYLTDKQIRSLWRFGSNSRFYDIMWKSPTLTTSQWWHRQPKIAYNDYSDQILWNKARSLNTGCWSNTTKNATIILDVYEKTKRKLTPIECERLQTLPDNYTEWVSNSQRYKMIGNWWTVDVIAHILWWLTYLSEK